MSSRGRGDRDGHRGGHPGSHPRGGTGGFGAGKNPQEGLGDDEYAGGANIFRQDGAATVPDPQITEKEDKNICLTKQASIKDLAKYFYIPLRPGYGEGTQFSLLTNYFHVQLDKNLELYRYEVKIEPISESARALQNRNKRRQFFNNLFEEVEDFRMHGAAIATDYANTLITRGPLFDRSLRAKAYRQVYLGEYEDARVVGDPPRPKEQEYEVTVTLKGKVSIPEIIRNIGSQPTDVSDFPPNQDAIQALDIIMAGTPNKDKAVYQNGQNKFYPYLRNETNKTYVDAYQKFDLGGCLIAVRGYYSSIRTSTSRILLNLNAQCSPFYPEINLLHMMNRFTGGSSSRTSLQDLEDFINKLRVRTEYTLVGNKRVTKVATVGGFSHPWVPDFDGKGRQRFNEDRTVKMKGTKGVNHDWGTADSIQFETINPARRITITQYFQEVHQIRLKHPEAMVLNCGSNDGPIWIPPELCTVMPGQSYRGILNDGQTTNMLAIAARPPAENARRITSLGLQIVGIQPRSENLKAFGIKVDPNMLLVHARHLAPPRVVYNNSISVTPVLADWNMRNKEFFDPKPIPLWSFLTLGRAQLPQNSRDQFQLALKLCGMGNFKPLFNTGFHALLEGIGDDDRNDRSIREKIDDISKTKVQIILVVLPTKSAPIYARVKYWADVRFGIHTVCCVSTKPASLSYWVNVAHKFNLKLGGVNHKLSSDALGALNDGNTMVVGIDVAHPSSKSMENSPSIVGMVASTDKIFAQWPGNFSIQDSRQEIQKRRQEKRKTMGEDDIPKDTEDMVDNIETLLRGRLRAFGEENKKYPKNILVYRDGVSEGQYQAVLNLELKPMKDMCAKLYRGKGFEPPNFTVVIVGKRHHTRFYPTNERYADQNHNHNPLPGTIVDRGITMQKGWDFYLQAHAALKGSAKPAHYIVIHNDMKIKVNELEKITHNLCYLYERCTKAVSYCPPAYYADRLSQRGRCYLMKYVSMRGRPPGTKFDRNAADVPWTKDVNAKLEKSMFYI